jgi:putative salt-induced outer membrane protein YdiY
MLRRPIVLCLFLFLAAPAAADTVTLTNGDHITGTVSSLAGGTLTLSTPRGDLKIAWADISELAVTDPLLVTVGAQPAVTVRLLPGGGPGRALLDPGGAVALADIAAMSRAQPRVSITGGANVGFVQTDGNTEVNSLRIDGTTAIRRDANRYTAAVEVNHATDSGTETASNWSSSFNYDRFLTERLFVNGNAIFTSDRFRDLDLRSALGAGIGYDVLTGPRAHLTANAGLGWVDENFDAGLDDRYTAARESAALDVFLVPDRITLFHTHDGYFGVTGDDNLFFKMKNGIRIALVGSLVTTVCHDLDYDHSPAPGRENTDTTFSLTFGYRF